MSLREQFYINTETTFLNFGSFGASPKPVMQRYQQFQIEMETDPVDFMLVKGMQYLRESKQALAEYINCNAEDFVYVTNPSYAVNIIAKSFPLNANDEVLATDIEYGACDKTWEYYCKKANAKYVRQHIPFPLESKEHFIDEFVKGITEKTKLIFISHITSATGLRLPVEEICKIANEKNITIFVDGAHTPGQIDLDISKLGADIYTGACHKWMMTPKGSSFLYVHKKLQNLFDPLLVSWGYSNENFVQSQFIDYHQMQGTRDFTAFLCIPEAIKFMKENNWESTREDCRKMVQQNALRFTQLLNATPLSPVTDDFIQQLYSTEIQTENAEDLHNLLYQRFKIQIPVMMQNGKKYIRYSIQAFNSQKDLDNLYNALEILQKENFIG